MQVMPPSGIMTPTIRQHWCRLWVCGEPFITQDEEGGVGHRHDEGDTGVEQQAEGRQHGEASREDPDERHPHLVPHVVQSAQKTSRKYRDNHPL